MTVDIREFTLIELIPQFVLNKNSQSQRHGQFGAYCLFIDIVGFTKLTTKLMAQGTVGAEQLSDTLNKLFGPLVDHVYEHEGFIPYFAGDAFLAFFEAEHTEENLQKCLSLTAAIQTYFANTKDLDIQDIAIKIGLSYGKVDWGISGYEGQEQAYYFRGEAIIAATSAQQQTKGGEVIMHKDLLISDSEWVEAIPGTNYAKLKHSNFDKHIKKKVVQEMLHVEALADFVPLQVIDYALKGEFREVVSVFVSFTGLEDYVSANPFFAKVRSLTASFSGYFKEIDFSDKGGVLVILFGAPVAFENNVERALEFALALQEEEDNSISPSLRLKIGITNGLAFTGMLGGAHKKQYVALGNYVNLAARLMAYSEWGQISVPDTIADEEGFVFLQKGEVHYKGFERAISTYTLEAKANTEVEFDGLFIGRQKETEQILSFLRSNTLRQSKPVLIKVYGEAGMGKSRLVYEVENQIVQNKKVRWHTCQADQILKKPFNPIIYFLKDYFEQNPKYSVAENQEQFEERWTRLSRSLRQKDQEESLTTLNRYKHVFHSLLGFDTRDTIWEEMDARARFNAVIQSVVSIFKTISKNEKLIVEFEDLHWFDEDTMVFLEKLVEEVDDSPIALICTSRYNDDGSKPDIISNDFLRKEGFDVMDIDLNQLDAASIQQFTEKKLKGDVSSSFLKFLSRTTNGNPFYLEQILEYLLESNLVFKEDKEWFIKDEDISISSSINSILMARVDRLSEKVKETVKTAAVIGREFEIPVLDEVMKANHVFTEMDTPEKALIEQIKAAEKGQIWSAINELKYIFKHSLLREAVYNMQLKSNLRNLHLNIAEAIEHLYESNLGDRYADLAFHFEEAEKHGKAIFYMKKAADFARTSFQNKRALMYYARLKAYYDTDREPEEFAKVLIREAEILELIGQWDESLNLLRQANASAEKSKNDILIGRTKNQLGKLLVLQGKYTEARFVLETAMKIFKDFNDEIGLFKVYGNLGDLYFRQGDYDNARSYFEDSVKLAKDFKDTFTVTQIVSNLGLTYMNQSLYSEAIACQKVQLTLCEKRGDRNGMAILNTNIGIVYSAMNKHEKAMPYYEKGYELSHELGNKQMEAIAIGCLGNIYQQRGNYTKALELYTIDLKLCNELGDKRGIAIVNGMMGELLVATGEFNDAKKNIADQLKFSEELQYQKGITKGHISLGQVHFYEANYEEAEASFAKCIVLADKIKYFPSKEEAYLWQVDINLEQDKINEAQEKLDFLKDHNELEDKYGLSLRQARVWLAKNNVNKATSAFESIINESKNNQLVSDAYWFLSQLQPTIKQAAIKEVKELYTKTPHYGIKIRMDELA